MEIQNGQCCVNDKDWKRQDSSGNCHPGGGVLPSKRLLGMCRWMGSHFHNRVDYNGVTFLVELLEWGRKFSRFLEYESSGKQGIKNRKILGYNEK